MKIENIRQAIDHLPADSAPELAEVAAYALMVLPLDRFQLHRFFTALGRDQAEEMYVQLGDWLEEK